MANTVSNVRNVQVGNKKGAYADVAISSYTSGGEPVDAGKVGLKCIEELQIISPANGCAHFGSTTDGKITAYAETTLEAAATADVGSVRVLAVGY